MSTKIDITTMQNIALHNGGKCLSKEYIDEHSPLDWMCEKGHRWESPYKVVNQGGWCVQCLKSKKKTSEEYLKDIIKIAEEKGGKCLSEKYINNHTKLDFQCSEGHSWKAISNTIKHGSWCPECGRKRQADLNRDSIETYRKIAAQHNGKCLSKEYVDGDSPLEFECEKGHKWTTRGFNIKHGGSWCHQCFDDRRGNALRDSIETFQKIAKEKGGKCLSDVYKNGKEKLTMQCAKGHIWYPQGDSLKAGRWCYKCSYVERGEKQRDSIETFHKIAKEKGGKCLSATYTNSKERLEFECSKGHKWKTHAGTVKEGHWCNECGVIQRSIKRRSDIKKFHEIAASRKGKCLSTEYTNNKTLLEFECEKGHRFFSIANGIVSGTWCSTCAAAERGKKSRNDISVYYKIAEKKGGKCLSTEYVNTKTHLLFECAEGHTWKAQPGNIQAGYWCPKCGTKKAIDNLRDSIETYQKIAAEHNGKCISKEYSNNRNKLEFECAKGHRWMGISQNIKKGSWCPQCLKDSIYNSSFARYNKIATDKGGKCLTMKIVKGNTQLEMTCANGHHWKLFAQNLIKGNWCPDCREKEKMNG